MFTLCLHTSLYSAIYKDIDSSYSTYTSKICLLVKYYIYKYDIFYFFILISISKLILIYDLSKKFTTVLFFLDQHFFMYKTKSCIIIKLVFKFMSEIFSYESNIKVSILKNIYFIDFPKMCISKICKCKLEMLFQFYIFYFLLF